MHMRNSCFPIRMFFGADGINLDLGCDGMARWRFNSIRSSTCAAWERLAGISVFGLCWVWTGEWELGTPHTITIINGDLFVHQFYDHRRSRHFGHVDRWSRCTFDRFDWRHISLSSAGDCWLTQNKGGRVYGGLWMDGRTSLFVNCSEQVDT